MADAVKQIKGELVGGGGDSVGGMVCHVGKEVKKHIITYFKCLLFFHALLQEDRQKLVSSTVEKFGALDFLVSNAAANPYFGPTMGVSLYRQ